MTDENPAKALKILIVDDSKVIRWAATKILDKEHLVCEACDGVEAWEILQKDGNIGVVFSDLQMPRMKGNELLEKIRNSDDPRLINIPVIIITSQDDDDEARERILNLGATDFISKPFDSLTLKGRAAAYLGYGRRVAELEEKIEQDKLSGLANKRSYLLQGEKDLALAHRHDTHLTVALLELRHFPELVRKFGQKVSAQLLRKIGQRIERNLRREDMAARLEAARFALILPLTNRVGGLRAVERICRDILSLHLRVSGQPIELGIDAGVTGPEGQTELDFNGLMARAEKALKTAIANEGSQIINEVDGSALELSGDAPAKAEPATPPEKASGSEEAAAICIDELLGRIHAGETIEVTPSQLAHLVKTLLPLLKQADRRLKLGLGEALKRAEKKLG